VIIRIVRDKERKIQMDFQKKTPDPKKFETEIGGRKLIIEIGKLAGQAHGSCTVQYGDTVALATAVINPEIDEESDFLPLTVDYEERLYAAGKIKGSRFIKREGRPSDEAVLTSRMVDRSIRPFFDQKVRQQVQVVLMVLSIDQENDPDMVSLIAASCALGISPIPWKGPVAGVRVGMIEGKWVLNPTCQALEKSDFDLTVVGNQELVSMIEFGGKEIKEETIADGIEFGHKHIKKIISFLESIQKEVGEEKIEIEYGEPTEEEQKELDHIKGIVTDFVEKNREKIFSQAPKAEQNKELELIKEELEEILKADNKVTKEGRAKGLKMVSGIVDEEACRLIMEENKRPDGRQPDEIRPLSCEVGFLPRTHGSGLFNRGETQVLSIVTLGAPGDEQLIEGMEVSGKKRYMHHYNFPGFSVGEVRRIGSPGRREIGHGALAEKAVMPVLPDKESFPYTIRVVSEVLSSNGSTSQASVCGSSLALMDAGVPITKPVAGISIGLMAKEDFSDYKILTDIQGAEDHIGGMDFKVAGTKDGITAMQVDVKTHGLNYEIIRAALQKAKVAREKILDVMTQVLPAPRPELSQYAPRVVTLRINPEKIRDLIGTGGKVINKIIDETGVAIDIEDDGLVMVTAENGDKLDEALEWIKGITHELQPGEVYEGKVTQIMTDRNTHREIGALVELLPGQDGMVHISQIAYEHVERVSDKLKVGDKVKVKVMNVDNERGRVELSMKALLTPPAGADNYHDDFSRRPSRQPRGKFSRGR